MLASLRMRRLGRQWARLNLGIDGKRAMAQYQLAATELAMACRRKSLGQTTEEAYVRHRDDSLTLMRAAAAIVRGQEQLYPPPWIGPDVAVRLRHLPPGPRGHAQLAQPPARPAGRRLAEAASGCEVGRRRYGAPSCRSSHSLRSTPQPYPVSDPSAPITRWHGHDDRDRVAPVGEADRAGGDQRLAERGRDLAVADRHAVGDPGQLRPDRELERRAARREGRSNSVRDPAKYSASCVRRAANPPGRRVHSGRTEAEAHRRRAGTARRAPARPRSAGSARPASPRCRTRSAPRLGGQERLVITSSLTSRTS